MLATKITKITKVANAVALIATLSPTSAEAKCAFKTYRVQIEVSSSTTHEKLPGVRLALFANGAENEELNPLEAIQTAATGPDGKLTRSFQFYTYSGSGLFRADRCDRKLRTLDVVFSHPTYRAKRVTLKPVLSSPSFGSGHETIVVPAILMDPIGP